MTPSTVAAPRWLSVARDGEPVPPSTSLYRDCPFQADEKPEWSEVPARS